MDGVDPAAVARRVGVGAALVGGAAGLLAPGLLREHQVAVLVGGAALGLPHGAVDHLVPLWARILRGRSQLLGLLLGYVGVALLAYLALVRAPGLTLPIVLVASAVHFGLGDTSTSDAGTARPRRSVPFAAVARGGLVLVVPLLRWPDQARAYLGLAAPGFALAPTAVQVGALVVGAAAIVDLVPLRGRTSEAVELSSLVLLFAAAPPLAAFGLYFGLWHALRHTARLIAIDPRNRLDLARGRIARPVRRFLASAAIPSLVAASAVAVLVVSATRSAGLVGPVFLVLLALTVPHLAVVGLMDARSERLVLA